MTIKLILKSYFKNTRPFIFYKLLQIKRAHTKDRKAINHQIDFYKTFLSIGDLCFDVGANIGNKSEMFLKIGCEVVAVEPQNYCAHFLIIRFGVRLKIVKKALSFENGKGEIITSDADTLSTLSTEWVEKVKNKRFQNIIWNKTETIEITTLDALIQLYGKPKYIKIDVEGYELNVIKGLSHRISYISFEFNFPESYKITNDCIQELRKLGAFVCNYALGETPGFILNDWVEPDEFLNHLKELEGKEMLWGDIYIHFI